MSASYPLPSEPEGLVAPLLKRFHPGKISALMLRAEAVFFASDEGIITDHTEIAARLERDLKVCLTVRAKARHVFVAGHIAGIVLDCSSDGTGHDGRHVHLGGSASDIVGRAGERRLRYLMGNI